MAQVRAVVAEPEAQGYLALRHVEERAAGPAEAVVRVRAISLNRGEVRRAHDLPAGTRIGYDLAGTIEAAAPNGRGPAVGTRVVGLLASRDAWAEQVPVPLNALAALPDEVSFAEAATLPVAGLTALHALRQGGLLLGRNVLVTGASGGVGHFAVQMAHQAGATVVALLRNEAGVPLLKQLGARHVVVDETGARASAFGPYDLILESVGGDVMAAVLSMLAVGGTCVQFGATAGGSVTLSSSLYRTGRTSHYGLNLFTELALEPARFGLGLLARLVADGRVHPQIEMQAPWTEIGSAAQQLYDRRFNGKAVLLVD